MKKASKEDIMGTILCNAMLGNNNEMQCNAAMRCDAMPRHTMQCYALILQCICSAINRVTCTAMGSKAKYMISIYMQ